MKVLVDTSVWINHFRISNPLLSRLLEDGQVLIHPLILGELACGNFKERAVVLRFLRDLPMAKEVTVEETLAMVEERKCHGNGVGLIDFMILAATLITPEAMLWTDDKRLGQQAELAGKACGPIKW
jgi:predicted nucleic acid-binding protein